ncbi:hypothetical protein D3C73_962470 [compost metagenome]
MKGATRSSGGSSMRCIFSSRLTRDWAWVALEALALKRSMNFCRWARSASCLDLLASIRRSFSARVFSKVS